MKIKIIIIAIVSIICLGSCSKEDETATITVVNKTDEKWNVSIQAEGLNTNFNIYSYGERTFTVLPGPFYVYAEMDSDSWLKFDFTSSVGTLSEGGSVTVELD